MKIVIAVVFLGLIANAVSLSCLPCDRRSCGRPYYCSAGIVKDVCNCCDVCAKGKGEKCGGLFGTSGKCGRRLVCVDLNYPICAKPVPEGSPLQKPGICLPQSDVKILKRYCRYKGLYCPNFPVPTPKPEDPPITFTIG